MGLLDRPRAGKRGGMKPRLLLPLALLCSVVLRAAEPAAFPGELKLANGAVLHNARAESWEKDRVLVKHGGGALVSVRYQDIAEPQRAAVLALSQAGLKAKAEAAAKATTEAAQAPALIQYQGQAFIATRGASNYKLGAMKIYVLPASASGAFDTVMSTVSLPTPLLVVSTDADGKFSFARPKDEAFVLFAQAERFISSQLTERYEWRIDSEKITSPQAVLLSNDNHRDRWTGFRFD